MVVGHSAFAIRDFAAPAGTLLLASALLVLSGCAGSDRAATTDPLLGSSAGRDLKQTQARPAALEPPTASAVPPVPPAPSPLTSNAALAAGAARTLDSSRDLRISETQPRPSAGNTAPSSAWGGTLLRKPEPVPETVARGAFPSPFHAPAHSGGTQSLTYEQAQAKLAAHGVTWQRLETWGEHGEWKFSCSVPNPQNPFISRNYEARARDYLGALRAVLEQMDKER